MTQSGSNSSALRKHFTPSSWLKPKHQFRPRSNQRCASAEDVWIFLVWTPRLKRSITRAPDGRLRMMQAARERIYFSQPRFSEGKLFISHFRAADRKSVG